MLCDFYCSCIRIADGELLQFIHSTVDYSDFTADGIQALLRQISHEWHVLPVSISKCVDVETGQKVLRLLDALEDLDDTQDVFSNADIPAHAYAP